MKTKFTEFVTNADPGNSKPLMVRVYLADDVDTFLSAGQTLRETTDVLEDPREIALKRLESLANHADEAEKSIYGWEPDGRKVAKELREIITALRGDTHEAEKDTD
jgi:hypothetical protein